MAGTNHGIECSLLRVLMQVCSPGAKQTREDTTRLPSSTAETLELYFIYFYAECHRKPGSYKNSSVNTM